MNSNTYYTEESNKWKLSFLRVLSISVLILLSIILFARRFHEPHFDPTDLALLILIIFHGGVYYIAKKGHIVIGSIIIVTISFLSICFMAYNGRGVHDSSVPGYLALLIITFMLLGWRYALSVLLLGITWLIILGTLTQKGILSYPTIDTIPIYIRDFSIIFILVYALSHLYIKRMNLNIKNLSDELFERSKAEKAIREKEENYRTIFEQASDGIIICDTKGVIMMANESMSNISKYPQATLLSKPLNLLFRDFSDISDLIKADTNNQQVSTNIAELTCQDTSTVPVEIRTKKLANERFQLFITGISERQKAEKSLRDFERIFNMSANPICIVSLHESILLKVNPALEQILEYTKDELLDTTLLNYMHPDDQKTMKSYVNNKTKSFFEQIKIEPRCITKSGKEIWLSWIAHADYKENIAFMVGHDMTEKKKFENELIEAKEKAEESDRLKTSFLENMSHEIRTPMNGIIGFSDMLKNRELADSDRDRYCNIILKSGQNLLSLVNNILDISRIETGLIEINTGIVDLPSLCAEIQELLTPKVTHQSVSLIFDNHVAVKSQILTDKLRLQQILTNLISNAIKFTHKGEIRVGCTVKGNMLEFSVKDTGIGIAEEMRNKIFGRFIQAELEISKKYGGTGLGLAISQKLVELLGGTIWVDSTIGKGSSFYFTIPYLPVKTSNNSSKSNNTSTEPSKPQTGLIMVVEDDMPNYEYLEAILTRAGYQVIHVEDGIEAIKTAQTRKDIDLILMDLKLPKLNGYEATRQIKASNPNIPIIAQTAYAMLKDSNKAIEAGCDDYLTKPLMKNELLDIVAKHLK